MFEQAGIPANAVVTTAFRGLAVHTARSMGFDSALVTFVEHPIFTREDAWIRDLAEDLAPALVRKLTAQ